MASFTSQVNEAKTTISQMAESASKAQTDVSGLTSILTTAGEAVAAYASVWSVKEIADFAEKEAEAGAKILETASTIGVGVAAYQELQYAAKQVGVEHEALDKGLEFFSKNIGLASLGVEKAKVGFRELGIDLHDTSGNLKSVPELFSEVSTKLEGLGSVEQRNAIESELFGKAFAGIAPLLNLGGAAIDDYKKHAEDLGTVLDQSVLDELKKVADQFRDLSDVVEANFKTAVAAIGPILSPLIDQVIEFGKDTARSFALMQPPESLAGSSEKLTAQLEKLNLEITKEEDGLKRLRDSGIGASGAGPLGVDYWEARLAEFKKQREQILELMAQDKHVPAMSIVEDKQPDLPDTSGAKKQAEELAKYKLSLTEMVNASNVATDSQKSLFAAIQEGGKAYETARVNAAGAAAVLKLDTDALRDHITASMDDRMAVSLAAQMQEHAKIATDRAVTSHNAMEAAAKSEYDSLLKLAEPTDGLSRKQIDLADSIGRVEMAYKQDLITFSEMQAQIKQLQTAFDASSKSTREIVSAVERGASGFLDSVVKIGQTKDPVLALGNSFLSLSQDMEKAVMQALILDPLMQSLGLENGKMGATGLIPSLMKGGASGFFSGWSGDASGPIPADSDSWTPAFATGGSFDVGGSGGTDSQNVAFKASPGEHVAISPPGQKGSSGDVSIVVNNNHPAAQDAQFSSTSVPDGRGGKAIIVQIDEAMAYGVSIGRSQTATALQQSGIGNPRTPISR